MGTHDQSSEPISTANESSFPAQPIPAKLSPTWLLRRIGRFEPIEWFTFFLVILTGVQVWSFIQSERAFVFPASIEFTGPLVALVQPLTLHLDVSNSGKSPAKIDNLIAFAAHQLPPVPSYDERPGRIKIGFPPVPPNGKIRQTLPFGPPWGEQTTREVQAGTRGFYVYGRIKYRDDYSWLGPKFSDFCFTYVPDKDPGKAVFRNCLEPQYTGY